MKKILFVPMNWGLGHATRCAELIHREMNSGNLVFIAGSGPSGEWLRNYFPTLTFLEGCPGYPVRYSVKGVHWWQLLFQWPLWEWTIFQENRWLKKQQHIHQFDEIISDNRFGIWQKGVHSIFITHQTSPILPRWIRGIYQFLFWKRMKRFDSIWIPDFEENERRLSGILSTAPPESSVTFIGWISRFNVHRWEVQASPYEWVGWISGPEWQRTVLEHQLMHLFKQSEKRCLIISGQPHIKRQQSVGMIDLISHLDDEEMSSVLRSAKKIFMRPGYSSLMDVKALHLEAELIFFPTPGQTEQEYLGQHWFQLKH